MGLLSVFNQELRLHTVTVLANVQQEKKSKPHTGLVGITCPRLNHSLHQVCPHAKQQFTSPCSATASMSFFRT